MRNFDCSEMEFCKMDCSECDRDFTRDIEKIEQAYFENKLAEAFYDNFNRFNY